MTTLRVWSVVQNRPPPPTLYIGNVQMGERALGGKQSEKETGKKVGFWDGGGGIREVEIWTSKVMEGGASVESKICTMAKIDHVHPLSSPNEEGGEGIEI